MSQGFDPYYKWLGIPPTEQPPHYYRLLGISLFEADPDVITYAADQRMAHVRTFQTGEHLALSQQLLNEIAAARVVLLSPERKAAYDEQLRQAFRLRPVGPVVPPPLPGIVAAVPEVTPVIATSSAGAGGVRRRNGSRDMLVGVAVVLLVGGGMIAAILSGAVPLGKPNGERTSRKMAQVQPVEEPVAEAEAAPKQEREQTPKPAMQLRARVRDIPAPRDEDDTLGDLRMRPSDDDKTPAEEVRAKTVPAGTVPPPGPRNLSDLMNAPGGTDTRGPIKITFPSGKVLAGHMFLTDAVYHQGKHMTVTLEYPNHAPWASISHDKGILNGITVARYEHGAPMFQATYAAGKRDGVLQFWTPEGQKKIWGQYNKGRSYGFGCLFRNDQPYLVLECVADQIEAVHLIAHGKLQKTFSGESQARTDATVKAALEEFEEIDTQLKQAEADFREAAREEMEKLRQQLVSKLNHKKREAIQSRINQRAVERQKAIERAARGPR